MSGYAKVFGSLFDGSLRGHSDEILVFINMLCHSDAAGVVDRHWRAISDETGLSVDRVKAASLLLSAPDPESRTPDADGRRIVLLDDHRDWGWRIVNHAKYRDLCSRMQATERKRRERSRCVTHMSRSRVTGCDLPEDGDADADASESVSGRGTGGGGWTLEQCIAAAPGIGMTPAMVQDFFDNYNSVGWIDATGRKLTDLASALGKWKKNQSSHGRTMGKADGSPNAPRPQAPASRDAAIVHCVDKMEAVVATHGRSSSEFSRVMSEMGRLYGSMGKNSKGDSVVAEAIEILEFRAGQKVGL
jgi:hypothetical protein